MPPRPPGSIICGGVSSQNCHHCSPQVSSLRRLSFWARCSSVLSFSSEGFSVTPFCRISIAFFFSPRWLSHQPYTARRRRRSEEHTSELQSPDHLVCRLLLEKNKHRVQ